MPIINGQKMACEPCIRGHRSTKCTHANERLMVPVRKPGRPLSMCPHPASRPCSCAQLTAAIPKKQKCGCGTNGATPSHVKDEEHDSSKETTPMSPSSAANVSYRVQKSTRKGSASGRKASVDVTGLERMDANQLNILPPYNGPQQKSAISPNGAAAMPDVSPLGSMGMSPAESTFNPMLYSIFSPPMLPATVATPGASSSIPNAHSMTNGHGHNTNGSTISGTAQYDETASKKGSCCGGTTNPEPREASAFHPPKSATYQTAVEDGKTTSCCVSRVDSPALNSKTELSGAPSTISNNTHMSPYPTPMVPGNGMFPFFPNPTIFTYPPQFGSFMQPLQPEQWRQMMMAMALGQSMMPAAPYNMPVPTESFPQLNTPPAAAGTSHQCGCGDGCQCVGCAAHPYNEATQSYVRSAWESMMAPPPPSSHGESGQSPVHTNGNGTKTPPTRNGSCCGASAPAPSADDGTVSPAAPQTPSDAPSGLSEEQSLSASDFFFVSYPFGGSCGGETASCPCGDDCQCLGCVIHGNPDTAEEQEQ